MQSLPPTVGEDDGSRAKDNMLILFDKDCLASLVLLSYQLLLTDSGCKDVSIGHHLNTDNPMTRMKDLLIISIVNVAQQMISSVIHIHSYQRKRHSIATILTRYLEQFRIFNQILEATVRNVSISWHLGNPWVSSPTGLRRTNSSRVVGSLIPAHFRFLTL